VNRGQTFKRKRKTRRRAKSNGASRARVEGREGGFD